MNDDKIRVFLSRPNPFTNEQNILIDSLKELLKNQNIETVTLQAKDYSPYESLSVLNEIIKRCYGMIILAFGHTYMEKGIQKKGAEANDCFFEPKEEEFSNTWITSSFCQIEGAMAIANNIPIIIIKQKNLKIEGILKNDEKIFSTQDFSLESEDKIKEYIDKVLNKEIICWKKILEEKYKIIENELI